MSTCPQCDQPGIFGYRDKNTGEMTWYSTTHTARPDHSYSTATLSNPMFRGEWSNKDDASSMREYFAKSATGAK
jgi:hypothetical protein